MKPESRAQTGSHLDPLALQAFVDHEASPTDSLGLARHLGDCSPCDRLRRRLEALNNDLSSLPGAEVPEGFSRRVMRRVATLPQPRRRARLLRLVAPTAAAMILAVAALANPWTVRLRVLEDAGTHAAAEIPGQFLWRVPWGPSPGTELLKLRAGH